MPPSAAESSPAAAVTAAPNRRPGCWPRRSIGPLTLIAATTAPGPSNTGALTLATPASRSPTLAAQPRRRTVGELARRHVEARRVVRPRQQHLAAGAAVEREHRAERHRVAQAARPLVHRDAHPVIAFADVELRALARRLAEARQHRARRRRAGRARRPRPTPRAGGRAGSARRRRAPARRGVRARPRAGTRSGAGRSVARCEVGERARPVARDACRARAPRDRAPGSADLLH